MTKKILLIFIPIMIIFTNIGINYALQSASMKSFFNLEECEKWCFYGIEPGVLITVEELEQILVAHDLTFSLTELDYQQATIYGVRLNDKDGKLPPYLSTTQIVSIAFDNYSGVVSQISVQVGNDGIPLRLSDALNEVGIKPTGFVDSISPYILFESLGLVLQVSEQDPEMIVAISLLTSSDIQFVYDNAYAKDILPCTTPEVWCVVETQTPSVTVTPDPAVSCTITVSTPPDLISAINTANGTPEAETVCLDAGTYMFTAADNTLYGDNALPVITDSMTLYGLGDGATLTRDSADLFRFFYVDAGTEVTFENLTLSNGDIGTSVHGGAIYTKGNTTLRNVTLSGNNAKRGGGIRMNGAILTLEDTLFEGNTGNAVYAVSGDDE